MMIWRKIEAVRRRAEKVIGWRQPVILAYHRVANLAADPWNLAVSPANFEVQIAALCRLRRVVPLAEIQSRSADDPRPAAAVTFDDGYEDVFSTAREILERYRVPATAFVTTHAVDARREYWWDELVRIVYETPCEQERTFTIAGAGQNWHLAPETAAIDKDRIHRELWSTLLVLAPEKRYAELDRLAELFGASLTPRASHRTVTAGVLRQTGGGLLSIGAHTETHPYLPGLAPDEAKREIERSRSDCQALTGLPVTDFAYPFGENSPAIVKYAREAGFVRAVTTRRGVVRPSTDPMLMPRFVVENWAEQDFVKRFP
jgi:peptidoglycan/xylan/chitin deacetylase (PgdA/CDA1 family)